jgi:hypothetical protein
LDYKIREDERIRIERKQLTDFNQGRKVFPEILPSKHPYSITDSVGHSQDQTKTKEGMP